MLTAKLGLVSQKGKLAEAIRYAHSRWEGLTRFIDDGSIEIDNNTVERSIRPIALNRKNALVVTNVHPCDAPGAAPLNSC